MSQASRPDERLAHLIDVSAVQAWHSRSDILELADAARTAGFGAAHVLPNWVSFLRDQLAGSSCRVGAPVGFPSGGSTMAQKSREAAALTTSGVDEIDVMLNVGRLRSGDVAFIQDELRAVSKAIDDRVPFKVILEIGYLSDAQIETACEAAIEAGAAFVKTASGWSGHVTTLEQIRFIRGVVGDRVAIKASGGIRDIETVRAMISAGASRFGINLSSARHILSQAAAGPTV